jgi:DNA-binding winged helix-turn-helix (wHTH) protein/TolB-like protein
MKNFTERDDHLYQFGPFCLDTSQRVLLRDGRLVPLPPKAFSTLLALVLNRGHLVEKDLLMETVWPDEVVEESNLAQHIFMLRKALGETVGNTKYIETVPRRGYRFVAPVTERRKEVAEVASDVSGQLTPGNRRMSDWSIRSQSRCCRSNCLGRCRKTSISDSNSDALITRLSNLKQVKVRPTSAVRNAIKDNVIAAGRALKVATVLEGTIQKWDEFIRVTVQLVSIQDEVTLWAQRFDEKFTNILRLKTRSRNRRPQR